MRTLAILSGIAAVLGISLLSTPSAHAAKYETAIFAGGCFWCMEPPFEKQVGVIEVVSGYTDGTTENPNYGNYHDGGHVEAVRVVYDPDKVDYKTLVDIFWRQVNPTDSGGQFVDRGHGYTTGIFYLNNAQKEIAEKSKAALEKSGRYDKPIVTPIKKASAFYDAEDYHQDYYKKNPLRYKYYRYRSGRDDYLESIWGEK